MSGNFLTITRLTLAGAASAALAAAPRYYPALGEHFHAVTSVMAIAIACLEMDYAKQHALKPYTGIEKMTHGSDEWIRTTLAPHLVVTTAAAVAVFAANYFGTYLATVPFVLAVGAANTLIDLTLRELFKKPENVESLRATIITTGT